MARARVSMMRAEEEKKGVVLALISAALWGAFPVVVNRGTRQIPPMEFAAVSALLAAAVSFIHMIAEGKFHELKKKEAYPSLLMVAVCVVIIPYSLFFTGSSKTSGINTSMLLLFEIIFTLMFTPLIGEKTTREKLAGSLGVFMGALLLLYNGSFRMKSFRLNEGDLLIIASTITYPIGNFYAKKALNLVSPPTVFFVRFSLGGLFLLLITVLSGERMGFFHGLAVHWRVILLTGIVFLSAGKIIWYEALKRLDISKAISLGTTFPLFSLLLLIGLFREPVSARQWAGIAIMLTGAFFSIKRQSVDPGLTGYAAK